MRMMEAAGRDIAVLLERAMKNFQAAGGDRWGFALMLFSFNGGEFTWISNANRADMVKTMQEFIAENPPDMTWDEQHG
jgi:pheromone shutdown protein TraB